jgi:hypothetical protein
MQMLPANKKYPCYSMWLFEVVQAGEFWYFRKIHPHIQRSMWLLNQFPSSFKLEKCRSYFIVNLIVGFQPVVHCSSNWVLRSCSSPASWITHVLQTFKNITTVPKYTSSFCVRLRMEDSCLFRPLNVSPCSSSRIVMMILTASLGPNFNPKDYPVFKNIRALCDFLDKNDHQYPSQEILLMLGLIERCAVMFVATSDYPWFCSFNKYYLNLKT